jgi:hypothetical protein
LIIEAKKLSPFPILVHVYTRLPSQGFSEFSVLDAIHVSGILKGYFPLYHDEIRAVAPYHPAGLEDL